MTLGSRATVGQIEALGCGLAWLCRSIFSLAVLHRPVIMRLLAVLLGLLPLANALYFHMREGDRRCFIEEVPEDTVVLGMLLLQRANRVCLLWHHMHVSRESWLWRRCRS